jgi:hypothetical protein
MLAIAGGIIGGFMSVKTGRYIQRKVFGVGFEIICKRYNHSSPGITMQYLTSKTRRSMAFC